MNEIIIQIIGFVAVAAFILSYQIKSNRWLIYDVIVRSYGGIVSESITMLSILISIIRFGWKGLEKDK